MNDSRKTPRPASQAGGLWLGFDRLDTLLDEAEYDGEPTVYLSPQLRSSNASMDFAVQSILAQVGLTSGRVGYWRLAVGSYPTIGGRTAFDRERDTVNRRLHSALPLVRDRVRARGFRVVEALFAAPRDLVLLDGRAEWLAFDAVTDTFTSRPAEPGGVAG